MNKNYTPMASVKDPIGILKFNKVRSPLKMPKSPEQKTYRPAKLEFLREEKGQKQKSKNKTMSVGLKKNQTKSKSMSSRKNLQKKQKT